MRTSKLEEEDERRLQEEEEETGEEKEDSPARKKKEKTLFTVLGEITGFKYEMVHCFRKIA